VGERRALVIASQCEGLNLLSFLPDAAGDVASALLDPAVGQCVPALPERPLLVDPTIDQLDDAITEAFARASEDEATLFIALVGHGEYTDDDFYFLTKDTKLPPSSRTAFMLAQRVRELLAEHSMLDGLVLLLDTCHAGIAAQQAAGRWIKIVGQAGRRFEVLTASDERTAANGCFSRQLVQVLRSGHPKLGERLRCPDMKTVLSLLCPMQTAVHLAFDGRREIATGDEGLWLAMNSSEAWRGSPAADNPAAAEIDRLTRDYEPPHQLASVVSNLLSGTKYLAVTGPAGTGKSRLVAALARPSVAERVVPPKLMDAVLFLSATDTASTVAAELARQLGRTVPGFADSAAAYQDSVDPTVWQAADSFQRAVLGPLAHGKHKARIAIDGIDNLPAPLGNRLRQKLEPLALKGQLQLVLSSRQTLNAMYTVTLAPSGFDIDFDAAPFRTTKGEIYGGPFFNPKSTTPKLPDSDPILDVLNAAGKAQLPTSILVAASGQPVSAVRDLLVREAASISRRNAGTPSETVTRFTDGPDGSSNAHMAIISALADLAPASDRGSGSPEQVYADAAEAEHYWASGLDEEAVESLENRAPAVPAESRDLWDFWRQRITAEHGPQSRLAIIAQARYLTSVGKTGDRAKALTGFQELLPVAIDILEPDDPEIFSIRNNIGYLCFELEDFQESLRQLRSLIDDASARLGTDNEETLHARHLYAVVVGKLGDGEESARLSLDLIPDAEAALGPHHDVTVNARLNYHFYTLENEQPSPVVLENRRRLAQIVAELADDDPRALEVGVIIHWDDPSRLKSLWDRSARLHKRLDHPETVKIAERVRALGG
jgi:tetratricopeptide (TPR) repeat protein